MGLMEDIQRRIDAVSLGRLTRYAEDAVLHLPGFRTSLQVRSKARILVVGQVVLEAEKAHRYWWVGKTAVGEAPLWAAYLHNGIKNSVVGGGALWFSSAVMRKYAEGCSYSSEEASSANPPGLFTCVSWKVGEFSVGVFFPDTLGSLGFFIEKVALAPSRMLEQLSRGET